MVSVIIPAFNSEKYIAQAIDSVLAQDVLCEIIVVDDGSIDATKDVVLSFGEKVRYFYQENAGVGAARNKGIAEARGEYIAFLDADDIWLPNKLAFQLNILRQNAADMVYGKSCNMDVNGRRDDLVYRSKEESDDAWTLCFEELFWENNILTSSVLIKKSCLEKFGIFNEDRGITEDYDLWLRLVLKIKIVGLARILFYYREHDLGISKDSKSVDKIKETLICNYGRFSSDRPKIQGKLKKRLLKLYFDQGHACFYKNKFKEARLLFLKGMRISFLSKCTFFYFCTFFGSKITGCVRRIKKGFKERGFVWR